MYGCNFWFLHAYNSRLSGPCIWDQSPTLRRIGVEKLIVASAGMMILRRLRHVSQRKNRPPEEQEADSHAKFVSGLEMEPHTSPNYLLAQYAPVSSSHLDG